MKTNKNIFLIVLVSLVILMIVPSISAEATNNEHKNAGKVVDVPDHSRVVDLGNGLIRYDHVHYSTDNGWFDNSAITEGGSIDDYYLMGVKWTTAEPFVINPTNSVLEPNDISDVITASLNTWDDEVRKNIFGDVTVNNEVPIGYIYDSKNSVTFAEFNHPGAIAVAYTWSIGRKIVESDVIFNKDFDWGTSGDEDKMDLQNIATHEFGHSAGLYDLYDTGHDELTTYGISWLGDIEKRSLASGDILGIHAIYGK